MLSIAGGGLGVAIAYAAIAYLRRLEALSIPLLKNVEINALRSAVAAGVTRAHRARRSVSLRRLPPRADDLGDAMKAGERGSSEGAAAHLSLGARRLRSRAGLPAAGRHRPAPPQLLARPRHQPRLPPRRYVHAAHRRRPRPRHQDTSTPTWTTAVSSSGPRLCPGSTPPPSPMPFRSKAAAPGASAPGTATRQNFDRADQDRRSGT